jgi:predicted lipid-binding transport protein (Tim44 family)
MTRLLLPAALALAVALTPGLADARAGSGASAGSRGGMTYSAPPSTNTAPSGAAPMQRSMTAPSAPTYGASAPGVAPRSSFGSGFLGGMIGGGIIGMMLGNGMFHGGFGGMFGLLIQLALIFFIGRWLFRTFLSPSPATAQGPAQGANMFTGQNASRPPPPMGGGSAGGPPPITIGPQDYQQFEQLLQGIQAAWSAQDLNGLRAMTTPEMLSYFNEQLSEQASRGVRNIVGDVHLQSGDLAQAWAERGVEYATVAMRFSMTDVTMDHTNRVVDGSATEHVVATEIWTFMRARGGHWVLSAIQQAR